MKDSTLKIYPLEVKSRKKFKLARPKLKHKAQALTFLTEFRQYESKINGTNELDECKSYDEWLKKIKADRTRKPDHECVPNETFFLMRRLSKSARLTDGVKERIVGIVNIRLGLNHKLWNRGGNIGYSIRPSERRNGYGKLGLFLALKVCENRGLETVLLTCDKKNVASAKTIKALGGKMIRECDNPTVSEDGIRRLQYYVIDVKAAIKKNASKYKSQISRYPK